MEDVTVLVTALNTGHILSFLAAILEKNTGHTTSPLRWSKRIRMLWTTYILTTKSATDICATPSKAKKSYPEVIADAFRSEPSHRMAVQQIHEYIFNTYPEMKERVAQVRSNIRHHLSDFCLFLAIEWAHKAKPATTCFIRWLSSETYKDKLAPADPCGVQLDENIICQNRYH